MARFAGDQKRDPRELTAEFHALPPEVRALRREAWQADENWSERYTDRRREDLIEDTITGALAFLLLTLVFLSGSGAHLAWALVMGASWGALTSILRARIAVSIVLAIISIAPILSSTFTRTAALDLFFGCIVVFGILIPKHREMRRT